MVLYASIQYMLRRKIWKSHFRARKMSNFVKFEKSKIHQNFKYLLQTTLVPNILTLVGLTKKKDIRSEYVHYIFLRKHKNIQNLEIFHGWP